MNGTLWVKFGWSEYYRGGDVDGNFGWLNEQVGQDDEGRGHEAFNFMPDNESTYYCYVPPQGSGNSTPWNEAAAGWTVVCLAKNPKHKGIHIVGWYENATLIENGEQPNPVAAEAGNAGWSYSITSSKAYFIPPEFRTMPFSDTSVRRGKYSFLEGPDVDETSNKRRVLAKLRHRMKALAAVAVHNPTEARLPDPELDPADPMRGFGTPETRKRVEKNAEEAVIAYYKTKGFTEERVTHLPCGFDFIISKGATKLHVEVKGTVGDIQQFFLTRNEHQKGLNSDPKWRLAIVTAALSDAPKVRIYNAQALKEAFDLQPYVYLGRFIPESEG